MSSLGTHQFYSMNSNSKHLKGRRVISAVQADIFNKKIVARSEWTSLILKTGDKLCQSCYNSLSDLSNDSFDLEAMDIGFTDQIGADSMNSDPENIDFQPFEEQSYREQMAKEELNAIFELLKMKTIRDD